MSISRAWLLCAALASCARPGAGGRRPSSLTPRDRATIRRILHEWRDVKDGGLGLPIGDGAAAADNATDGGAAGAIAGGRLAPHPRNIYEWHFTVAGPPNSSYERGLYHGVVLLPRDYPAAPPRVRLLTPSGRFAPGADICLSASAHHPETWSAKWQVRTLVTAMRAHFLAPSLELGGVDAPRARRRALARASRAYTCPVCGVRHDELLATGALVLPDGEEEDAEEAAAAAAAAARAKRRVAPTPAQPVAVDQTFWGAIAAVCCDVRVIGALLIMLFLFVNFGHLEHAAAAVGPLNV